MKARDWSYIAHMVSGTVIPIAPTSCITVDYWGSAPNVLAAFCTHAHMDHLQGLSDIWTGGPGSHRLSHPIAVYGLVDP